MLRNTNVFCLNKHINLLLILTLAKLYKSMAIEIKMNIYQQHWQAECKQVQRTHHFHEESMKIFL